ncbi:MAG TPA: sulfatase-like hydrolase/transferase [Thermomicrobiales bacterium]|nr:sulfatase-like hydrolase/transferase [Thermomicrobiales bacterium]
MADDRPNILLITSDQQHYSALGSVNPKISTPALDRLAAEGTRFDRAYCPSPVCSPSRSSIITGQYPSEHGCWTIGVKLDEDAVTLPQLLGDAGYDTALVGKAHFQPLASTEEQTSIEAMPTLRDLDFWRDFHGPWYGFNHVETARMHGDEYLVGQHYAIWMEEKGLENWVDYFQSWPPDPDEPKREHAWDLPEELHYTTWTGERTVANIERAVGEGKPFFHWASFHDPHPPYVVPEPWASMYDPADMEPGTLLPGELDAMPPHFGLTQLAEPDYSPWQETPFGNHGFQSHLVDEDQLRKDMAIYYGMTSFMDDQIGKILDTLDRLGIADNTIVVFGTDHGHFLGQHGLFHKGAFHYEDLLRLPFLVRWPGQVPQGSVSSDLQSLVDLAPSFLEAAGEPVPGGMQGVSQLRSWRGEGPARDWTITENRHQPTALSLRTLVTDRYKITVYRGSDDGELFDLHEDPDERRNRWHDPEFADVKAAMLLRFVQADIEREPTYYPRIANA